jgi:protein TonB
MIQVALQTPWPDPYQIWSQRHRRWLRRALWLSLAVHVVFAFYTLLQPAVKPPEPNTLEVILVNSQTERIPEKADALAQVALDGGGDQKEGRSKSPLPAGVTPKTELSGGSAAQRLKQLESQQKAMKGRLLQPDGDLPAKTAKPVEASNDKLPVKTPSDTALSKQDFRASALELARLEAQIAKQIEDYNKRPRLHFFAPSTSPYVFAIYEEHWRQKVERYGNLNYPDDAKGRVYGQLRMTVYIRQDGSLQDFVLDKSSGSPILDRAAKRIVEMAGPYGPFTPDMAKAADVLVITRTWMFTNDSLETRQR